MHTASSRLQPTHAAATEVLVGTQMTISGLSFSMRRCVGIPADGGGTRNVQVSWQQDGRADCTTIQFFETPDCTGPVVDILAQGKQMISNATLPAAVVSAGCDIDTSNTTASSEYPDSQSSSMGKCGFDRLNPCLAGSCIDSGTQQHSCVCPPNLSSRGTYCAREDDREPASSITVAGSDWRCKDVYTMYGLTLQQFTAMNPGINCSVLLNQSRELVVRELLQPCSAFYFIQPDDTCFSVAQFLGISKESLKDFNPGISCSARLPAFRSLCVERDPAKARWRCVKQIQIGSVVDFKQVAASNGVTLVDLCRLNPWLSFRDAKGDSYGVSLAI
ncbi:unnamed protein product [Closterium sp. Yama58-4]|nr:unnamed protein product [Closterium sp. Yama58-4]